MAATTIEQSKHLLEFGLPKETADMSYSEEYFGKDKDGNDEWCWRLNACKFVDVEGIIPAWSLSALLEVLPLGTELDKMRNDAHEIYYEIDCADATGWVGYEDSNPITAAYEMVCWLLEQGLIEKGGNNETE